MTRRQDEALLKLAREGVKHMTPEMWEEQRRSFAFGNGVLANPDITRASIDRAAEQLAREKKHKRAQQRKRRAR